MKKYGKDILATRTVRLDDLECEVFVLDGGKEFFDIHIVMPEYQDTELNTLRLQEEKANRNFKVPNKIELTCYGLEYLLWHKFYGVYDKIYDFSVNIEDELEVWIDS